MTTPISVFMPGPKKKAKNGTLAIQTLGLTDLKHGMQAQIDFGSNMGGISPDYIQEVIFAEKKKDQSGRKWCVVYKYPGKNYYPH